MDAWTAYRAAVLGFVEQVERLPDDRWDGAGLGEWDLRALVGHTSRSLVTVTTYLAQSAPTRDLASSAAYYVAIAGLVEAADVVERGRAAGVALGDDPPGAVRALADSALEVVADRRDRVVPTIAGGMLVSDYLPTRTFELTVHGLDIAAATGVPAPADDAVLTGVVTLAGEIAVRLGHGPEVLAALTGRTALPVPFSVV